jgi:hypothetical protein
MAYTRRHFARLLQCGAAMTAAGFRSEVFARGAFAVGNTKAEPGSDLLDKGRFEPLVGSRFLVPASSVGTGSLTLLAVESMPHAPALAERASLKIESSILRFSGAGAELREGTYLLEHETTGAFHLYLSPGRPGRYLAILAHLPQGYLNTVSIPRRAVIQVPDGAVITT